MARVHKSAAEAREHLRDIVPRIGDRYKSATARAEWSVAAASEEAETNFSTRMSEVLATKKRQTRCREVGDSSYRMGCATKGAPIIGARISAALDKYMTNFGQVYTPVLAVVDALPRRGIDAMANIDNRLKPTVAAWIANKLRK